MPPTEEDKYLKYESETKTPRRKTKTQKHRKHAVKTRSIPIATQEFTASKKRIHQPSNTRKKTLRHVKLQNITNSSKRQKYNENQKHITCSWNSLHHEETYCITKNTIHERRGEQKHTKSQLRLTTPTIKVNNTTDLQHQNMQQAQPNKLQITLTATSTQGIPGFNTKSAIRQHKELRNPINIMEQTPWPGNHEYKPWPGYTQAKLLWIHQNHHLQWQFTSGQQSWTSKTTPKDIKTNILETIHHGKTQ